MDELPKKHLFTKMNYLLDLAHLNALEGVAPEGSIYKYMSDLCLAFLKETPQHMQELDKVLTKGDGKAIKQQSYKFKRVCSGIGAIYMADLCLQIEKAMMDDVKDIAHARKLGEQLKDAFLVTRDQIQAYLAQLPKPQ